MIRNTKRVLKRRSEKSARSRVIPNARVACALAKKPRFDNKNYKTTHERDVKAQNNMMVKIDGVYTSVKMRVSKKGKV
jgi:hypothetical protein